MIDDLKPFITDVKMEGSSKICTACRLRAERYVIGTRPDRQMHRFCVSHQLTNQQLGQKFEMIIPQSHHQLQNHRFDFENVASSTSSSSPLQPLDSTFNTTLTEEEDEEEEVTMVMNVPFEVSGSGGVNCICCFNRDKPMKVIVSSDLRCGSKMGPLAKPLIGCTTDGYIIDVWGSFTAATSDGDCVGELKRKPYESRQLTWE